jgi:hypothetical protein
VPSNCAAIRTAAATGGILNDNDPLDITTPAGGLYGFNSLITVTGGTKSTIDATALDNFLPAGAAAIHYTPGTTSPSLEDVTTPAVIVDGASVVNFAGVNAIDNVSAVLMRDVIANDYVVDADRDSKTDWVITFPTRVLCEWYRLQPVQRVWNSRGYFVMISDITDREERSHCDHRRRLSPKPPTVITSNQLCNEVNTLTVKPSDCQQPYTGLFGGVHQRRLPPGFPVRLDGC